MGMSRYKLAAQLLALAMFTGLALWHYLMRHYDLILPPALLACGLLVSLPLQWLGRLRPALADYLMLVGALTLFAIEAPGCINGMLWLGLPAVVSLLVLSLPLAVMLNIALVPAWTLLLGGTHVSLLTLSMGWWLALSAALVLSRLDARRRRRCACHSGAATPSCRVRHCSAVWRSRSHAHTHSAARSAYWCSMCPSSTRPMTSSGPTCARRSLMPSVTQWPMTAAIVTCWVSTVRVSSA